MCSTEYKEYIIFKKENVFFTTDKCTKKLGEIIPINIEFLTNKLKLFDNWITQQISWLSTMLRLEPVNLYLVYE